MKIQMRKPRISDETKLTVAKSYKDGMAIDKIVSTYRISKPTLYKVLKTFRAKGAPENAQEIV